MTTHDHDPTDKRLSRRTLTLAAGVAALGVALGMRSNAHAQGKMEGKYDAKGEGKADGKYDAKGEGKYDAKGEGKYDAKGEGKYDAKGEGKFGGKEGRRDGKGGRIKVDVDGSGTMSVDVKCAEGESMQTCADLTKEIIDRVKVGPPR